MPEPVAGIVLAAGAGHRFGMPKALVVHQGSLFVERAARVLADGDCEPIIVVLGAGAERVRERAALPRATLVLNPEWPSGMGSSLRMALDTLSEISRADEVAAALVIPVDMPGISTEAVRRVAAEAGPEALAAASHGHRRSHPVLLGRAHWVAAGASAVGDVGARNYLNEHDVTLVRCDDVSNGNDIDRPEDFRTP